jgi:hypothetical protein
MKYLIVGSLTALLASAGLGLAQAPDDETLPPPRTVPTGSEQAPADQQGATPGPIGPNPWWAQAQTDYGPPPTLLAPVCGSQGPPFRFWTEADYLLWFIRPNHYPPLLTSGSTGILGRSDTTVVLGGSDLDRTERNGGRLTIGGWITDYQGFGLEGSFFVLESIKKDFTGTSTGGAGSPALFRPFFNVLTGAQDSEAITFPGVFSGTVQAANAGVQCDTGRFAGADAHFIGNIACGPDWRWDFLVGYRYLTLDDRLSFIENQFTNPAQVGGGTVTTIEDRLNTSNRFNGFDIGLRAEWHSERFLAKGFARVAFGATDETVGRFGQTTAFIPGTGPVVFPGGFFALPSNFGTFTNEQFAVVPELGFTLAYQVFDWARITFGYSFLYWSNVARNGAQINGFVNPLEVPSLNLPTGFQAARPLMNISCTDFWAHGISLGLELRY